MFYEPPHHPLPHDPLKALVAPRPIGWISALSAAGELNLSPYSFFNQLSSRPALVMFSSEGRKDAVTFIDETREFVCNIATLALADAMNKTSAPLPRGQSEFVHAGLETAPSRVVKAPRVRAAAAALECRHVDTRQLASADGRSLDVWMVIGEVVGVHIDEAFIVDGRVDTARMQPLARCGYADYAVVDKVFSLARPTSA
jgi:flavin reductase (DIM6/NTAB) family NADH-FMN oxidoreductase RutF